MATNINTLEDKNGNIILPRTSGNAVSYDNTASGLTAASVQAGIDELASEKAEQIALDSHLADNANKAHGGVKYALLGRTSDFSMPHASTTTIPFDNELHDDLGFFDSTNNRFKIPAGVAKVVLKVGVSYASNSTGGRRLTIWKNGSSIVGSPNIMVQAANGFETALSVVTPIISVAENDYFEVVGRQQSGSALNVLTGGDNFFAIEVVE